jgi:hypothetical protein
MYVCRCVYMCVYVCMSVCMYLHKRVCVTSYALRQP